MPSIKVRLGLKKTLVTAVLVLCAAAFLASVSINVVLYRQMRTFESDPQIAAQRETAALIARVRALMVLPDEQPTIATVTDPSKLQDQEFFQGAKLGDKVLIFTAAKKAILYDPAANRIVDVAPLSASAPQPAQTNISR